MSALDHTHDPAATSWVPSANTPDADFPVQNLPYGRFRRAGSDEDWRCGVAIGTQILDLRRALHAGRWDTRDEVSLQALADGDMNRFMSAGPAARRATLDLSVSDLFPGGDLKAATFWSGLRPMTPDSTPIIGGTRYDNVFINAGHGTLGWTMSCGSGKLLADLVSGNKPDIRADDLGISRYN